MRLNEIYIKFNNYNDLAVLNRLDFVHQIIKGTAGNGRVKYRKVGSVRGFSVMTNDDRANEYTRFALYDEDADRVIAVTALRGIKSFLPNSVSIQISATHPDYRRKGLMLDLYKYIITKRGINLFSDTELNPNSLAVWTKLAKDVNVYYATSEGVYGRVSDNKFRQPTDFKDSSEWRFLGSTIDLNHRRFMIDDEPRRAHG